MKFLNKSLNYNDFICIEIDDYPYFFDSEITIFQACLEKNITVPRFCYHSKLSIAGNCRICSVEEKKSEKVILSCSTLIDEETEVFTSTFLVLQARENVIEYLLSNHPLDCPICDQGGECDLQDQAMLFGGDVGRFYENFKRSVENKNFSPLIKFSLNRCIHCARCTRYFSEISDSYLFSLLGRGQNTEISFYNSLFLSDETSGNVIDLCPVGALTSKPYSFIGRIWEYIDVFYVDIFDDFMSNIRIDVRGTSIVRILPDFNYFVNDEWISDKIRFNYDSYSKQRLTVPFFILSNKYYFFSWLNSLFFLKKYFFSLINFYLLKNKKNYFFTFGFDRFNDVLSSFFVKQFSYFYGLNFFFNNNNNSSLRLADSRFNYINNSKLEDFDISQDLNNGDVFLEEEIENFCMILMNLNLRYESPIYNIKFKKILKDNLNCSVFNFGFYNFYDFFSLGFNHLSFFKNLILLISKTFTITSNFVFFFGTSFFYNNSKFLNILYYFKLFFFNVFKFSVLFNYVSSLANRVINYELNTLNSRVHLKNNYGNLNPFLTYNIDLNEIPFNFIVSKNNLLIYHGHHNNQFVKYSNLVLPSTIFIERPDLFINTEGYFRLFFYNYFKYFLDTVKDVWSTILIFFKFLNCSLNFNFSNVKFFLNQISPIFHNKNNNTFIFDKNHSFFDRNFALYNFFFEITGNVFFNFINDFYLFDSISRYSLVMSVCSKKYTIFNDFQFLLNIYGGRDFASPVLRI